MFFQQQMMSTLNGRTESWRSNTGSKSVTAGANKFAISVLSAQMRNKTSWLCLFIMWLKSQTTSAQTPKEQKCVHFAVVYLTPLSYLSKNRVLMDFNEWFPYLLFIISGINFILWIHLCLSDSKLIQHVIFPHHKFH